MDFNISDRELIERAQKGDKDAYKALFDKYHDKVLNYLYRYMGDYEEAQEVTVDTFLDVYYRLPDYEEEGRFLSWVFKIAVNFAKKRFRRRKKVGEVSLDIPVGEGNTASLGDIVGDDKLSPDQKIREDEFYKALGEIVRSLDKKYRSVLLLCDMQDLSYEEAARVLNISRVAVATRLKRARRMLFGMLRERGFNVSR